MPIRLADLESNLRTINVAYFQFNAVVTYRPALMTPEGDSQYAKAAEEGEDLNFLLIDRLCKVMVTWDLVDEDGEMYPITPDALGKIDSGFLRAIIEAIGEDRAPKTKSAGRSFAR